MVFVRKKVKKRKEKYKGLGFNQMGFFDRKKKKKPLYFLHGIER
jgi:hypothetical protein